MSIRESLYDEDFSRSMMIQEECLSLTERQSPDNQRQPFTRTYQEDTLLFFALNSARFFEVASAFNRNGERWQSISGTDEECHERAGTGGGLGNTG